MGSAARLLVALVALAAGSCVYASMRDLRDLGIGETKVTCASRDGKVHCSCRQKCYSEEHDCRCADER